MPLKENVALARVSFHSLFFSSFVRLARVFILRITKVAGKEDRGNRSCFAEWAYYSLGESGLDQLDRR